MEELVHADQNVEFFLRKVANSLENPMPKEHLDKQQDVKASGFQQLQFTQQEESHLESKMTELLETLARQCDEWHDRLLDHQPQPHKEGESLENMQPKWQQICKNQEKYKLQVRQLLVRYRQRAKAERVLRQRAALLPTPANDATKQSKNGTSAAQNNSNAMDVTASLRRTKQVMSQEIQRVSSVTKVLDDGTQSLKSSHHEYDSVNTELVEVRKRLKALQWQAYKDRLWISAGIAIFLSVALHIIYERTGIPFLL